MDEVKAYFIGGVADMSVRIVNKNIKRYNIASGDLGTLLKEGDVVTVPQKVHEYRLTRTINTKPPLRDIHIFEWEGLT